MWLRVTDDKAPLFAGRIRIFAIADAFSRFILAWQIGGRPDWSSLAHVAEHQARRLGDADLRPEIDEAKATFKDLTQFDLVRELLFREGFDRLSFYLTSGRLTDSGYRPPQMIPSEETTIASVYLLESYIADYYNDWIFPSTLQANLVSRVKWTRERTKKPR